MVGLCVLPHNGEVQLGGLAPLLSSFLVGGDDKSVGGGDTSVAGDIPQGQLGGGGNATKDLVKPKTWSAPIRLCAFFKGSEV